ncbi:MAG: hypothetical protein WBI20_08845 [Burkholderiaceae bacterium]
MIASHKTRTATGIAALLGLCAWVFSTSAMAQVISPEKKLAAIRHELVQAALETPTQVQVTQWVDSQGALRESNSFRNGMKIRGVRVLSYLQEAQGETSAKLEWQTPVPHDAAATMAQVSAGQNPPNCKRTGSTQLHHVVDLSWNLGSRWSVDDLPLLLDFKALLSSDWERRSTNTALWRLAEPRAQAYRSSYDQALLASGADDIPWKINLSVQQIHQPAPIVEGNTVPSAAEVNAPAAALAEPPLKLQLQMTLSARQQNLPLLQFSTLMELQAQRSNWDPARLDLLSRQKVLQQASIWAQDIQSVLSCLPVMAQVTQATKSGLRINAGTAAGVRIGDQWLLADGQKIPQRLLEADVATHTVLAKVQYVDQYHAQLQVQAGTAGKVQRNWAAWAAEESH